MAASAERRHRKCLSLADQYAVVMEVEKNPELNRTQLAQRFNISRPSINSMLKRKRSIVEQLQSGNFKVTAKRVRKYEFEDVDEELLNWFRAPKTDRPASLSGSQLLEKARALAVEKGYTTTERLNIDWLNRWKRRHSLCARKTPGDIDSVYLFYTPDWKTLTFSYVLSRYNLKDVYNVDETALYWRALPESTHKFCGEQCQRGEWSKERLTVLVGSNADGNDKLPLLMIGRNVCSGKTPPVQYTFNRAAWMTASIFENWLRALDQKFAAEERHVALLVDDCPSHSPLQDLTNIEMIFLPKNATSHSQPMEAGVMRMLKGGYKKRLLTRRLCCYETGDPFMTDLFQSMSWLKAAWDDISAESIAACFRKVTLETEDIARTSASLEDNVQQNSEKRELLLLWERLGKAGLLSPDSCMDEYLTVDSHIITGDYSISSSVLESDDSEDTSEIDKQEAKSPISVIDCLKALDTVRHFFNRTSEACDLSAVIDRLEARALAFTAEADRPPHPS